MCAGVCVIECDNITANDRGDLYVFVTNNPTYLHTFVLYNLRYRSRRSPFHSWYRFHRSSMGLSDRELLYQYVYVCINST